MDLSTLTDTALSEREASLRLQVDRGLNNGCQEYLVAVLCEQGKRSIAACRSIIDGMRSGAAASPATQQIERAA